MSHSINTISWLNSNDTTPDTIKELCSLNNLKVFSVTSEMFILNYEQVEFKKTSNIKKGHPINTECRNLVVHYKDNKWIEVAHSFHRFLNFNDNKDNDKFFIEQMNSGNIVAIEKLDGSLILVVYLFNKWWIFTRGSNADTNPFVGMHKCQKNNITFGDKVRSLVNFDLLNKDTTYIFELCVPGSHITNYENEFLGLLQAHNTNNGDIITNNINMLKKVSEDIGIKIGNYFNPKSIKEVEDDIASKRKDFEGYVLWHPETNRRLKIKNKSYVILHHNVGKISYTDESILDLALSEDWSEIPNLLTTIKDKIIMFNEKIKDDINYLINFPDLGEKDRKTFALKIKQHPYKTILFNIYNKKDIDSTYIKELMRQNKEYKTEFIKKLI